MEQNAKVWVTLSPVGWRGRAEPLGVVGATSKASDKRPTDTGWAPAVELRRRIGELAEAKVRYGNLRLQVLLQREGSTNTFEPSAFMAKKACRSGPGAPCAGARAATSLVERMPRT